MKHPNANKYNQRDNIITELLHHQTELCQLYQHCYHLCLHLPLLSKSAFLEEMWLPSQVETS